MKNFNHGECHRKMAERYTSADINEKLTANIRGLGHTLRFMLEGKGGQRRILSILNEDGPMTQRELTARLNVQPGSASEVISKLEDAGLILREPNHDDRRTADISLNDDGRREAAEAVEQKKRRREEMFACLTDEEKETLLSILEKLHSDWEEQYKDADGHHGHRRGRRCGDDRAEHFENDK